MHTDDLGYTECSLEHEKVMPKSEVLVDNGEGINKSFNNPIFIKNDHQNEIDRTLLTEMKKKSKKSGRKNKNKKSTT